MSQDTVFGLCLGFAWLGSIVGAWCSGSLTEKEAADCAVGNMERKWWREAIAKAEFRKSERKRNASDI